VQEQILEDHERVENEDGGGVLPFALEQLTGRKEQVFKDTLEQPTCVSSSGLCSPREGLVVTLLETPTQVGNTGAEEQETSTPRPR
jgi:hypothetical protein